ncbi:MAG: hypothetical protein KBB55_03840 [Candidatus Buchananbacteria bacterium]|nr:hypothetical protein [Candidatus Buchananbacteria bacterium]
MNSNLKLVVFVPLDHADALRAAMAEAGAGKIGNYTHCSFSSRGIGRFKPVAGANPSIGTVGEIEAVEEERIEVVCSREILNDVITAIKRVHPYEEVALDVHSLENI